MGRLSGLDGKGRRLFKLNRPRTWAIVYLLLIPGFALAYRLQSDGFFHSTSQLESSTRDAEQQVATLLKRDLAAQMEHNANPAEYTDGVLQLDGGWKLPIDAIVVGNLSSTLDALSFRISATAAKQGSSVTNFFSLKMSLLESGTFVLQGTDVTAVVSAEVESSSPILDFGPIGIYDIYQAPGVGTDDPTLAFLEVSPELDKAVYAYRDAVIGRPTSVSGGYLRMLYLSAVTITTLGIGDIVPTTQATRLLVGLEAILGVVVIGLFLNSLFARHRDRPA